MKNIIKIRMNAVDFKDVQDMIRRISKVHSLNTDAVNVENLLDARKGTEDDVEFYKELISWRYVALQQLLRRKNKFLGSDNMTDEEFVQECISYYRKNGEITEDAVYPLRDFTEIMQAGKKFKGSDISVDREAHFRKFMNLTGKNFANAS
jgi:hypothetical protein